MINTKTMPGLFTALIMVFFLATNVAAETQEKDAPKPSNKWRISFSGGADSDGVIDIDITPLAGHTIHTTTAVTDGTSENHVAKTVVESLKTQLPEEAFHVERDDGEDVLIKKKRGAANFAVEIVNNTVEGVRIKPKRK